LLRPSRRREFSRQGAARLRPYSGYSFLKLLESVGSED
jgi:hypothetical protein